MTDDDPDAGTAVRRDRFAGGPARGFMSSLAADQRLFAADLAVDRAHVVMLAEQGIVSDADAATILAALDNVEAAGHGALSSGEDVHEAIETAVIEHVGDVGGRMHTARSRNDEVAACIRYRLRADLLATIDVVNEVREALLDAAALHVDTVMPGYTHLQPAQPITVGHWLAGYEQALARDAERLCGVYDRVNRSPLGAAAFAGTTFDINRERTAELLGFVDPETAEPLLVDNTIDAVSGRDVLLETAGALTALAVTCSGIAEDLVLYANRGLVELDDDYASTSSIMPQKKNPDSLELVRAVAGDAAGAFQGVATTLKGLPRAYNRDLQRVGPHVWTALDDVTEAVAVAGGAVTTATWDEAALETAAAEGFSTATGVADLLTQSGVPFRTAHEVVASAAEAVATGNNASGLTSGENQNDAGNAVKPLADDAVVQALDNASQDQLGQSIAMLVDPDDLAAALDPTGSAASRGSRGGPAPAAVRESLDRAHSRYNENLAATRLRQDAVESATNRLDAAVNEYTSGEQDA